MDEMTKDIEIVREFVRRNVGGQLALDALDRLAAQSAAPVGAYTPAEFRKLQDIIDRQADRILDLEAAPPPSPPQVREGLTMAMEIVGNMRQSEAGLFDAAHSGQRGEDRSNALYDAYHAIRKALSTAPGDLSKSDPLYDSRNPNHGRTGGLRDPGDH